MCIPKSKNVVIDYQTPAIIVKVVEWNTYSKIKQMISASSRKLVWPPGMWGLKPTLLTYVHSTSCPGKVPGGPTNSKHSTGKTYLDLRSWSLWNTCNCHSSVLYIQQVLELHQSQEIDFCYCVIHRRNKTEWEGTKRNKREQNGKRQNEFMEINNFWRPLCSIPCLLKELLYVR